MRLSLLGPGAGNTPHRLVALQAFLAGWAHGDAKNMVERHPGWPAKLTSATVASRTLVAKGRVLMALGHLTTQLETQFPLVELVDVLSKPARTVVAKSGISAGGLVLVPTTTVVKAVPRANRDMLDQIDTVEVVLRPPDAEHVYFLCPATAPENVSPLWCVRSTVEASEANVVWAKYVVTAVVSADFVGGGLVPNHVPRVALPRLAAGTASGRSAASGAAVAGAASGQSAATSKTGQAQAQGKQAGKAKSKAEGKGKADGRAQGKRAAKAKAKAGSKGQIAKAKAEGKGKSNPKDDAEEEDDEEGEEEEEEEEKPVDGNEEVASELVISIPVLICSRYVAPGEALLVHKAAGIKRAKKDEPAPITMARVAKARAKATATR